MHDCQSRIALSAYLYRVESLIVGSLFVFIFLQYLQNIITTFAGTGIAGVSGDGGPATSAQLASQLAGIATDISGNVYVADLVGSTIRKVNKAGIITTFAGGGGVLGDGSPATYVVLDNPTAVTSDISGNVYICDQVNFRILKVASTGIVTTIAGTGTMGTSGDGGPATSADLYFPRGVAADTSGNVYITDYYNSKVRRVSSIGIITNFAGGGSVLGDGGPATSVSLGNPWGIAVDIFSNNVYICDAINDRIRMVNSTGIITTIAGGTHGGAGDGGAATAAQLNYPTGVAIDRFGNVYIADSLNHKIRLVSSTGIITTIAGTGVPGSGGGGGPASSAQLNYPQGVALDAHGHLYIADNLNNKVRSVFLSASPTVSPTPPPTGPSSQPSAQPSKQPSQQPTSRPSRPSGQPSRQPSGMAVVDIGLNPSILSSNHAPVSTLTAILTLLPLVDSIVMHGL